ncbi:hypothetical protein D779_2195 [Imhoffiella purpurea]|uniref:DUF4124 domain-containing protein n=2 Tax=Imhoffiella purpurea TaxID=1249627 RepID=W9VCF2_9GAMM|nr:hypothetical protein D779_2195 [Imhoffiella purpurea]
MYKCDDPDTGKPIYSQTPCAPDAEVMELDVHRPTPEQIRRHQEQMESERRFIEESSERRKAAQEASKTAEEAPSFRMSPPQTGKPADL